jgi:hypothetical protein
MRELPFWRRALLFLAREIQWGWLAGMALLLTMLAGIVLTGAFNSGSPFLLVLALVLFAFGGILIGNRARRHPFLNALAGSVLCVSFGTIIVVLYNLGAGFPIRTTEELGGTVVILVVFVVPQLVVGAAIAVFYRYVRGLAQRIAEDKERPDQGAASSQKRDGKKPAPKQSTKEHGKK